MIFTLFTVIIFIAELIITVAILINLFKLDLKIVRANWFMSDAMPKIKEIMALVHKISDQIYKLAPDVAKKMEGLRNKIILWKLKSLIVSIVFLGINIKVVKKFKGKKFLKLALKGLSLLQNMV